MRIRVDYDLNKKEIVIKDINIDKFKERIIDTYKATSGYSTVGGKTNILNIFTSMEYTSWENTEIRFPSFFAIEVYELFSDLAHQYRNDEYAAIAEQLYERTWISNYEKKEKIKMNTLRLSRFTIEPEDFQKEFIENYASLKFAHDLDGYILSFEQGLGKTFTAVAIAECLNKEHIYIICPNAVKDVWAREIKSYYKKYINNNDLWKNEVFIIDSTKRALPKKETKFFIVNQEAIDKLIPYVKQEKNNMIIIDESQNFRGLHSQRTELAYQLKEKANCHDILLLSGTPIKAKANELTSALRLIDPHFTPELAEKYYSIFSEKSTDSSRIARERFKRVIYRKLKKDTIKLPDKIISEMKMKIPNEKRFGLTKFHKDILELYHKEYLSRLHSGIFTYNKKSPAYRATATNYNFNKSKEEFENIVRKYSRAHEDRTEDYLNYIFQRTEDSNWELINSQNVERKYFGFLNKMVIPFVNTKEEKEILKSKYNGILGWSIAASSASAYAIGTLLSRYKIECYKEIWKYNVDEFLKIIASGKKKTVIFSSLVEIVDYITEDLIKHNIGVIEITGNSTGKTKLLDKFKSDDSIQVLVATTETFGTGITITEASQVLFFGTPYRSTDFEQAADRVHRIGQTDTVYIYNILLYSQEKNITNRVQEILNWSESMFDSLMNESEDLSRYLGIILEEKN